MMLQGDSVTRTSGVDLVNPTQLGFPAELTSGFNSQDGYSWKRLVKQGQAVTSPSMQLNGKNAVTPDGNRSLEAGAIGWMEPDPGRRGYFFIALSAGGGEDDGECTGCEWVASLRASTCLKVSVASAEGDCDCGDPATTEVILSSSDGITWNHSATNSGGGTGGGEGCCDGITLPDAGNLGVIRDDSKPFNLFMDGNYPISLVEPGHWSTTGGFNSGPDIHIQCVDGVWTAWQDVDPDNFGTLLSAQCNLVNPSGGQTYALIEFYFDIGPVPATASGRFIFRFETGEDPSTADRGGLLTRCGVDYSPTFTLGDGCDPGCLSLTSIGGVPCCGDEGSETVPATVVIGGVTHTGTLPKGTGQSWSGSVTAGTSGGGDCDSATALSSDTTHNVSGDGWFIFDVTGVPPPVDIVVSGLAGGTLTVFTGPGTDCGSKNSAATITTDGTHSLSYGPSVVTIWIQATGTTGGYTLRVDA